jgi:O-antigen/teichoic acid export membrane protein
MQLPPPKERRVFGKLTQGSAHALRGMGWGLADQALSSVTNFALGVALARALLPADFGAFSIAFGVYTIALGITRALSTEPLSVRFSAAPTVDRVEAVRVATGTALSVASLLAIFTLVCGWAAEGALASALTALGWTMPGLLLQDAWRFAFFAMGRGRAALLNDLVWCAVLLLLLALLLFAGEPTVFSLVLIWGASGTLAAIVGLLQARIVPRIGHLPSWLRSHRDLIPRFTAEFGLTTLVAQCVVLGVGALAGLAQAGAIRAAEILLGPVTVVYLGISLAGLPEGVRALRVSRATLARACAWWSTGLALVALTVGTLAANVPDRFGKVVLGATWPLAQEVVFPLSVGMVGAGIIMGAGIGLRSLAAARLSLRARLLVAPLVLGAALGGAAAAGARGAAWGLAFGYMTGSFVWWHAFRLGLRHHANDHRGSSAQPGNDRARPIPR